MDIDLLQNWLVNNTITKFVNEKPITTEITSGKKIGAIMPVYVLGGFIDIDKLVEISCYLWYSFNRRQYRGTREF